MTNLEIFCRKNRDRHLKTINKILYKYEDAEDIVQESYLLAYKYLDTYNPNRSSFNTWFNKILFNTLRKSQVNYKKQPAMMELDIDECEDRNLSFNTKSKTIEEHIDEVKNERHRKFLVLFYLLGYSAREIALTENTTVSNVTTLCSRFKKGVQ